MTRRLPGVVAIALALAACVAARVVEAQSRALVIRNVTLIDGSGGAPQPGMTVVVTGNRITSVGKSPRVPATAQVVDASGQFMIPGLWDMHIHIHRWDELDVLAANGVSGVRLMSQLPAYYRMRVDIGSGRVLGPPRMSISSRIFDGLLPNQKAAPAPGDTAGEDAEWRAVESGEGRPLALIVTSRAEARQAVATSKATGAEFIKIHDGLTPDAYFAIADEAKKAGLYLSGHVPTGVSVVQLSDSGMRAIEHFTGMLEGCSTEEDALLKDALAAAALPPRERGARTQALRRQALDTFSAARCTALAAHLAKNDTFLSPTFMPEAGIKADAARVGDLARYVPARLRARWQQDAAAARVPSPSADEQQLASALEDRQREIVRIMRRGGVRFLAGTDTGRAWRVSGFSLHDDLVEMNHAGLTPMEVIESATSAPARLLGRDKELGTVQVGKLADLVLLDADPLQQTANTRRINAVVLNGRLLDRQLLDDILARLAAANANSTN